MRRASTKLIAAGILGAAAAAGVAIAADQTILGNKFQVKNPGAVTKRKIKGTAKEKASPNTLVGNPTSGGATLEVFANGGTSTNQTFNMPSSGWTSINGGFKYKDPQGANGPVKVAKVKKTNSGKFLMSVLVLGKNGLINVVPPNPGATGCFALSFGGGDRYSVEFGPTSQIKNKGTVQFLAKKPTAEGICPTGASTTSTTTSSTTSTTVGSASPSFVFIDDSGLF